MNRPTRADISGRADKVATTTTAQPSKWRNPTWADLMRRGLDLDVLHCPGCGGRLRFIAAIIQQSAVRRILEHLQLPTEPRRPSPARAPPDPAIDSEYETA